MQSAFKGDEMKGMETEPKAKAINLTYEERQAMLVLRKLILRKPEAVGMVMQGMTRAGAVSMLVQITSELNALQLVARAFSEAAKAIVQLDKKEAA
jgi:hypothetical protein